MMATLDRFKRRLSQSQWPDFFYSLLQFFLGKIKPSTFPRLFVISLKTNFTFVKRKRFAACYAVLYTYLLFLQSVRFISIVNRVKSLLFLLLSDGNHVSN